MLGRMLQRRSTQLLVLATLAALAVFAGFIFSQQATASTSQIPTVALVVDGQAKVGAPVTVKLIASNVDNLAGFQSTVEFDQANVTLSGAVVAQGLAASQRGILPLGPIERDGAVVIGAATCPTGNCESVRYKTEARQNQGVQGQVELAEFVFVASAAGSYDITLSNIQIVNPQGDRLATSTTNTVLSVTGQ